MAWELDDLDRYLGGMLTKAAEMLHEGHTSKLFGYLRDDVSGYAGLQHELKNGLLTPENQADRARREAEGRAAAAADAQNGMRMEIPSLEQAATIIQRAAPGCMRGLHDFGQIRGPNGEGECRHCGTIFVFPK